jgi:hypothetical protein
VQIFRRDNIHDAAFTQGQSNILRNQMPSFANARSSNAEHPHTALDPSTSQYQLCYCPLASGHAHFHPPSVGSQSLPSHNYAGHMPHQGMTARHVSKDLFASIISNLISSKAEFVVPLRELCDQLSAYTLSYASYIRKIVRRKQKKGLKHEFLIVEFDAPGGQEVYLRLERAAARNVTGDFTIWSISSIFPPDDTARVALNSERLISGEESDVKAEASFQRGLVTLSTLNALLSSFIEVSKNYSLTKENCWFFCSVVLQILCERFPHRIEGSYGHETLGADSRDDIRARFLARLGV